MVNEDNIILEIKFEKKTAKGLEDHTKILKKFIEQMKKTGFGGGSGGSGGGMDYQQQLKLQRDQENIQKRIDDNFARQQRLTTDIRQTTSKDQQNLKYRQTIIMQEKRVKERLMVEEKRHWNSIIERMVSGTMGTKAMGMGMMGIKGGIGAARGLGQLGMKGLGKTGTGQAFALEAGLSKEGDFARGYDGGGAVGGFRNQGLVDQKDVDNKRAKMQGNKLASAFTKTLSRTKAFGDKMGMSGKTGKALGIAGIGAMGIVGGVITKAIESSPIAQAMMKMMSTAFTLILRPIGDFFGGFMKPIAVRLLKFGAENVKNFANIHKMGEKVGIAALALFTDPAAVIGMLAERVGASIAIEMRALADPFFNKTEAYSKLFTAFDEKMQEIAGTSGEMLAMTTQTSQQITSGLVTTNTVLADVGERMEEVTKSVDSVAKTNEVIARASTPHGGYASAAEQQEELINEMRKSMEAYPEHFQHIAEMDKRNNKTWFSDDGQTAREKIGSMAESGATGLVGEKSPIIKMYEDLAAMNLDHNTGMEEMLEGYREAEELVLQNKVEQDTQMVKDYLASVNRTNKKYEQITDKAQADMIESRNEQKVERDDQNAYIFKMQEDHAQVMNSATDIIERGALTRAGTENSLMYMMKNTAEKMNWAAQATVAALMQMASSVAGKGQGDFNKSGFTQRRNRATGGMINEHVIGVGQKTGSLWEFGERGLEYVTPATGSTSNAYDQTSNVTVNINVAKMTSDLDLQKIKPMVERALRETHSRRGII